TEIIARLGGVMIIIFGLHFMGVIQWLFKWTKKQKSLLNNPLFSIVMLLAITALSVWAFVEPLIGLPVAALIALAMVVGGAFTSPGAFWLELIERIELSLYADTRQQMQPGKAKGLGGSFMMGVVFSAGWTPCIGPLLGTILTLAANTGDVGMAIPLLTAYSLGLGIPFILTALLMDRAQGILRRLQRHMRAIELISGGFLVIIGLLVASGQLTRLTESLNTQFADFSSNIEECGVGLFEGEIQFSQLGSCLNETLIPVELRQGSTSELTADIPELTYLFHITEDTNIDVELSRFEDGFMPIVMLLDSTDNIIAEGSELMLVADEDDKYVILADIALTPGKYRVVITQENADATNEFRIKIRAAEALAADNIPDVVILDSGTIGGESGTENSEESAVADLALEGAGGLSGFADDDTASYGRGMGDLAFNFTLPTDDRGDVDLADYRGDIVILNFWGTWCGPCRREMPELQSLYNDYSDEGIEIVAVAARDTMEKIAEFREDFELTFVLGLDEDESISDRYAIPGRPSTLILDRDGVIRFQSFSLVTEAQIIEVIEEIKAEYEAAE
ncbi:MAG: redoxin domain-containing protein, partial [Aggregatilineales bacterium]